MKMLQARVTHLKQLEAESIHAIKEVAAGFDNTVIMCSVGKKIALMLNLFIKALYPSLAYKSY